MGLFTLRCTAQCEDSPRQVFLANKLLQKHLLPQGYFECQNTPGLWKHATSPISFTLIVDNFGVKYVGKEHVDHLIKCIKTKYKLTEDWAGDLYCGIKLNWDYTTCTLNISMPGYITQLLQKKKQCIKITTLPILPGPQTLWQTGAGIFTC